jgi:cupin fold WbuC family metalloprotein
MIKIDGKIIDRVVACAKTSERKRLNYNFHKNESDTLQRMLNAIEPGTYVQPHKHENPDKREVFILLKGNALVIEFDNFGEIKDFIILSREKQNYAVEIQPGNFHTIISLTEETVVYELKDGPYNVTNDKYFAEWAPKEGDNDANKYLIALIKKIEILENS